MTLAWLGALAIGLSLGLLGSGGSILTVPVLVYLVGQDEKTAIAGSLFVVGAIAAAGGVQYAWKGRVVWRSVLWFGLPGMVGTLAGARLGERVPGALQLAVFAGVMLAAAALMFAPPSFLGRGGGEDGRRAGWKLALEGAGVGVLTGFVGVGGGFLIVPALVLLGSLSMELAIGTSLAIITLNAFTGFWQYSHILDRLGVELDWPVLVTLAVIGTAGSFVGRRVGQRLPQRRLRQLFAAALVAIGAFILWQKVPEVVGRGDGGTSAAAVEAAPAPGTSIPIEERSLS